MAGAASTARGAGGRGGGETAAAARGGARGLAAAEGAAMVAAVGGAAARGAGVERRRRLVGGEAARRGERRRATQRGGRAARGTGRAGAQFGLARAAAAEAMWARGPTNDEATRGGGAEFGRVRRCRSCPAAREGIFRVSEVGGDPKIGGCLNRHRGS